MPMLYADDYVSPRRGFRDPLRMTQNAHVCSEFRSSGETKTFKPFKPFTLTVAEPSSPASNEPKQPKQLRDYELADVAVPRGLRGPTRMTQ